MSGGLEDLRLLGQKAHRLGHGLGRLSRHDAAAGATRLQLPGDDGHRCRLGRRGKVGHGTHLGATSPRLHDVAHRGVARLGQPLLGGIDKEENLAALQKNIDAALAKDSAK